MSAIVLMKKSGLEKNPIILPKLREVTRRVKKTNKYFLIPFLNCTIGFGSSITKSLSLVSILKSLDSLKY